MCCIPFLSPSTKAKLKDTFTAPRSANGFIVREISNPPSLPRDQEMQQRQQRSRQQTRRASTWSIRQREWKADIERLDKEAKMAEAEAAAEGASFSSSSMMPRQRWQQQQQQEDVKTVMSGGRGGSVDDAAAAAAAADARAGVDSSAVTMVGS